MKKLILLFMLVSGFAFGQMENFSIGNNQVTWNKVYEGSKTIDEIKKEIENRNNLKITNLTDNSIIGEFSNLVMDYKRAGFTYMGTPMILNETNKFSGSFKIEFKENRYRATIWNLTSKGMNMTLYGGGIGLGSDLSTTLEEILLKNGKNEFRNNSHKVSGKIINVTFLSMMDFTQNKQTTNDW